MKVKNIFISTGLILSAVLGVSSNAQAASFKTNFSPNPVTDPTADIELLSIEQNGITISDFALVNTVNIISNNSALGPASTAKGDTATSPGGFDPNETPTEAELAAYLGNKNLNNIVDSEDNGTFRLNAFFDKVITSNASGVDSLFFWERGMNSDIQIQALKADGSTLGIAYTLTRNLFLSNPTGYSINTTEVDSAQRVGAYGVNFANLGLGVDDIIAGIQVTSLSDFNGPDFKFVGANVIPVVDVPEPTTMLALGSVAALALLRRRQMKKIAS